MEKLRGVNPLVKIRHLHVGSTPPDSELYPGLLWLDNTNPNNPILKYWTGSSWKETSEPIAQSIQTIHFHPSAVAPSSDTVDGFHASQTPQPNVCVVSSQEGRIKGWELENVTFYTQILTINNGNINWDLSLGNSATVTLTQNATLQNPTNKRNGGVYLLFVRQDSTGGRILNFGSDYVFDEPATVNTIPNSLTLFLFISDGDRMYGFRVATFAGGSGVGAARGYFGGGYIGSTGFNIIDRLEFSNETRTQISATLSVARGNLTANNSLTRGYFGGGGYENTNFNIIDRLEFSNETNTQISATLSAARHVLAANNSATRGYFGGGWIPGTFFNTIDRLEFANETCVRISATLSNAVADLAANNSFNRGYFGGGHVGNGVYRNTIDRLEFSNETCVRISATLSAGRQHLTANNYSTRGYFAGGWSGNTAFNIIDRLEFSNETCTQISATLSVARLNLAANNSATRGYFGGGHIGSTFFNTIDRLEFSNETCNQISATLSVGRYGPAANQSGGIL